MKRLTVPKFWPIERKTKKFAMEPSPGPHPKNRCLTLGIVMRDIFEYSESFAEAKKILNSGSVKVDGKLRKDIRFPVGLMDVIQIGNEFYRVVPGKNGICIKKTDESSAKIKLLEIKNKKIIRGGNVQLNLHDGKNIIYTERCSSGDVIVFDIEKMKINEILPMEKGALVIITSGRNIGKIGRIEKIVITKGSQMNYFVINIDGRSKLIPKDYAFVIGIEKPVIKLGVDDE